MILWRNTEIILFYHFDFDPRFPLFLLYVRWKSGVTFVRRCFRDVLNVVSAIKQSSLLYFINILNTIVVVIRFAAHLYNATTNACLFSSFYLHLSPENAVWQYLTF